MQIFKWFGQETKKPSGFKCRFFLNPQSTLYSCLNLLRRQSFKCPQNLNGRELGDKWTLFETRKDSSTSYVKMKEKEEMRFYPPTPLKNINFCNRNSACTWIRYNRVRFFTNMISPSNSAPLENVKKSQFWCLTPLIPQL